MTMLEGRCEREIEENPKFGQGAGVPAASVSTDAGNPLTVPTTWPGDGSPDRGAARGTHCALLLLFIRSAVQT
jgi:hypothetical protein